MAANDSMVKYGYNFTVKALDLWNVNHSLTYVLHKLWLAIHLTLNA